MRILTVETARRVAPQWELTQHTSLETSDGREIEARCFALDWLGLSLVLFWGRQNRLLPPPA